MLKNTLQTYGSITKFLHWLMAILFLGMFIIGYIMINIPKSSFRFSLYDLHKATGLLLFAIAILRLTWRLINVQPGLSKPIAIWQHYAAKANIIMLYVLMFVMPMTGFFTSTMGGHDISFYNLFIISALGHNASVSEFFSQAHYLLSYIIITLLSLHVLASLYHHYFIKDGVLKRMWIKRN